jgi:hypothetical protein
MKRLWVALFVCAALFLGAGSPLSAQETSDVRLYFAPATGGSRLDREFFDVHIPREISGPHHTVVDSREEADFLVSLAIVRNEDPAHSSTLIMGLSAASAASDSPLLELFWNYLVVEEMYTWGIGAVLSSGMAGDVDAASDAAASDNWRWRTPWLYVGLRGGGAFSGRYFQARPGYYSGYSAGIGAEGGLAVELRLFRFLSLQGEGNFVYEVFNAPGMVAEGDSVLADTFRVMSLIFPVVVKAPLNFGRFTLSLYAGAYYFLAPWDAEKQSGATGETESVAIHMELPLGLTLGTDLGFALGPGELFADLRYGRDFGATVFGERSGVEHIRDRINVCLGYKFGF